MTMIFECHAIAGYRTFKTFVSADSEQVAVERAQRKFARLFVNSDVPRGLVRLELYRADDLEEYVLDLVEETFDRARHHSKAGRQ